MGMEGRTTNTLYPTETGSITPDRYQEMLAADQELSRITETTTAAQVDALAARNSETDSQDARTTFGCVACLGTETDIFYPEEGDEDGALEAKAICAVCPVREACLELAITRREKIGIWGGYTERERRRLIRQRKRAS